MATTEKKTTKATPKSTKTTAKKTSKKAEEKEEQQLCHGAYAGDTDDNCEKCPDQETCMEETEAMEEELDAEEEEGEEESDDDDDEEEAFDIDSLDLESDEDRIDILSGLSLEQLTAIVEKYEIDTPDDDEAAESEIILAIDDHFGRIGTPADKPVPKKKAAAKKKAKPEPEPEEEDEAEEDVEEEEDDEPEPPKKKVAPKKVKKAKAEVKVPTMKTGAADSVAEILELILTHNTDLLAANGDVDHLTGIRNHLNGILTALGVVVEPSEVDDEADDELEPPKKKAVPKKKATPDPEPEEDEAEEEEESDEDEEPAPKKPRNGLKGKPALKSKSGSSPAPEYFGDLAEANELTVTKKDKRITAKGEGRGNIATLLLKKGGWLLVLNGGDVDTYPGTVALASWNDQPSIDADSPKAEGLLKKHIKASA